MSRSGASITPRSSRTASPAIPRFRHYHQSWVGLGWTMHMGMVHNYSSSDARHRVPRRPARDRLSRITTAWARTICLTRDFMKYDKTSAPPL
ncbi:MAG: hypothetical protein MZU79_08795, partial [Anaerotruncus sp.]|nr:hypothetical protein [Anaerotruncus sp.]